MSPTQLLKVAKTKMSQNPLFFLELFVELKLQLNATKAINQISLNNMRLITSFLSQYQHFTSKARSHFQEKKLPFY